MNKILVCSKRALPVAILSSLIFVDYAHAQTSGVQLYPDWNQTSMEDLEEFSENGQIGSEYNQAAGYEVSRTWSAGQAPEDVLKLGDLENSLSPQQFTLEEIFESSDSTETADPGNIALSDFPLVGEQTIESLVEAVPNLGQYSAASVEPIAELLEQQGESNLDRSLDSLIADEAIARLELESLPLEQYTFSSIPNLSQAVLGDFDNYQNSLVSQVPGLSQVPLGSYPNPISAVGNSVARVDLVWGGAESDRNRTISGSYIEGFEVPCESNCEYFELNDLENSGRAATSDFEGKQWIAGREHWVAGGTGCLSGGREPTGIHPFGDSFKTVLWRTDESTDTGEITMFFNIKTMCGSSAYFIGPIPFPMGNVTINDWIYLGVN
ncbi:MAG: hypothetical protein ACRC1Z_10325 [Waterburya sp.]